MERERERERRMIKGRRDPRNEKESGVSAGMTDWFQASNSIT